MDLIVRIRRGSLLADTIIHRAYSLLRVLDFESRRVIEGEGAVWHFVPFDLLSLRESNANLSDIVSKHCVYQRAFPNTRESSDEDIN